MRDSPECPNDLEAAVMQRMAAADPPIFPALSGLRVASREYTGVGRFTDFAATPESGAARRVVEGAVPVMLEFYS